MNQVTRASAAHQQQPEQRSPQPRAASAPGRVLQGINLGLFLLGVATLAVVANFFAQQDGLRVQFDATKTRAYSLSPQTRQLMADLEGSWKIAVIMDERRTDRAMRRQIDEVLKRFADASPNVTVARIDPDTMLLEYEAMLAEVQAVYQDSIAEYDRRLDEAVKAFEAMRLFVQQHSLAIEQAILAQASLGDDVRNQFAQRAGLLTLLADEGELVLAEVDKALRLTDARPIADYETARSILVAALTQAAAEINDMGQLMGDLARQTGVESAVRQFASTARRAWQDMAVELAQVADPLKLLPPMELSVIGNQLQQGEAAIVIGSNRAAVIPSAQLFPKTNLQQRDDGGVSFDQRFRGEQLIAAAIRSLNVEYMPRVVFVHADTESMLRPRPNQADLIGVRNILQASRFDVSEWMVAQEPDRPTFPENQPVVWVIVPPSQRQPLELPPHEQALFRATQNLLEDGHAVLLSVYPSLLPRYGQPDPWASLTASFGVQPDTQYVIYERVRVSGSQMQMRIAQLVNEYGDEHRIARAVAGQDSRFTLPVPVRATTQAAEDATSTPLAFVKPNGDRWLERQWSLNPEQTIDPEESSMLSESTPVAMAAQRPHPRGIGQQRLVVVGAGSWMLSFDADKVFPLGGNRIALVYPGNYELMLASVAWLADMDDLIAASPLSQEIPRLRDITPQVWWRWFWIAVVGLPLAAIVTGIVVAAVRRT